MEGLVLRRIDYGESDQVIKIFSKEKGNISAVAKGIKRSRRRFPHRLEPFRVYEFKLGRKKPGQDLYFIQAADQLRDFEGIKADIGKIALGNFILELILISVKEEHPHPALYTLVTQVFQALCETDTIFPLWFYAIIHMMRLLGFAPDFETCLKCKTPIQNAEDNRFDPAGGGVVCPKCAHVSTKASMVPISSKSLGILQFLKKTPLQGVSRLKISSQACSEITPLLTAFVTYHLEKPLKTLPFLQESLEA